MTTGTLITLFVVLAHLAVIVAVLTTERRRPSATVAWLLSVIFLPGLGAMSYLLIGQLRARRVAKRSAHAAARIRSLLERHAVGAKLERHGAAAQPAPPEARAVPAAPASSPQAGLGRAGTALDMRTVSLVRLGNRLATTRASHGNAVRMLVNGPATYRAIIEAVEAATDHVHVEFYIIQPDETGRGLRDRLTRRAGEGVRVRVVYDDIGCSALPSGFWDPLVAAGGKVAPFHPVSQLVSKFRRHDRVDFRNHRKIVVIDGRTGFTGGINVGREYLGLDDAAGRWRDTHVRIEGPAVLSLQEAFATDWLQASGEELDAERYFPEPVDAGECMVQIIDSGPDRTFSPIAHVYVQALALARHRIWIATPYFVPSEPVENALVSAALRGVDVRLLLPARSDSRIVGWASRSYAAELLEAGVRIFEYQPGFMHAKTLVVDEWMGTIGSTNLDMRSFQLNYEINAFIFDERFTRELGDQFLLDLREARELELEGLRCGLGGRLVLSLARLLSPLL